jgi:hypothetical protein
MIIQIIIVAFLLLLVGFPILIVFGSMIEKEYLRGDTMPMPESTLADPGACERYKPPSNQSSPYPPSPYFFAVRELAEQMGFTKGGDFCTRPESSLVKGNQSIWLSPDRMVMLAIEDGRFSGLKHRRTELVTRLDDGSVVSTRDESGFVDISGLIDIEVVFLGDLPELWLRHQQRIRESIAQPVCFQTTQPLVQYEAIHLERGKRLVDAGLAKYVERPATIRFRFRGAVKRMRSSRLGARPDIKRGGNRINQKRPGDKGYQPSITPLPNVRPEESVT